MTGRGGDSSGSEGVKVLRQGVDENGKMSGQGDEQVVEFVHDEFFHALQGIIEFLFGSVAPNIAFAHLCGDELEKWGY